MDKTERLLFISMFQTMAHAISGDILYNLILTALWIWSAIHILFIAKR